jgi:hypothetical protein
VGAAEATDTGGSPEAKSARRAPFFSSRKSETAPPYMLWARLGLALGRRQRRRVPVGLGRHQSPLPLPLRAPPHRHGCPEARLPRRSMSSKDEEYVRPRSPLAQAAWDYQEEAKARLAEDGGITTETAFEILAVRRPPRAQSA